MKALVVLPAAVASAAALAGCGGSGSAPPRPPAPAGRRGLEDDGFGADPAGGRVVTYAGWPLYTYVGDTAPGTVKGQGLDANGGLWYVLSPAGNVIRTKASSGS